ncbi:MAG: sigma-70 family RNA polymerase sigma factor [Planctomycetes bacterium]|nr:sigma-70 family RNA polymerase sigma factor [Planctomycetota bacterium]
MSAVPSLWNPATSPGVSLQKQTLQKPSSRATTLESLPRAGAVNFIDAKSTDLMRRFQNVADDEVFGEIYRLNATRIEKVVNSCLRFAPADLSPEDIIQDVFISVFRSARHFHPEQPNSFRVWTSQIARNAVRRALRGRRGIKIQNGGAILEWLPARAETSENSQFLRDGARALPVLLAAFAAALESLLPRDRQILEAAEVRGESYEQIAATHRLRRATVRMIVFRARQRLVEGVESLLFRPATLRFARAIG